jgi:hypothetical protein
MNTKPKINWLGVGISAAVGAFAGVAASCLIAVVRIAFFLFFP